MKRRVTSVFIALLVTAYVSAEDVQARVAVKETAAKQLAYARWLARAIPVQKDAAKRREVVAHALAALRVVKAKWPEDAVSNAEAHVLASDVYAGEAMLRDALTEIDAAEALPFADRARLLVKKGTIHHRFAQHEEAVAAFEAAEEEKSFRSLEPLEQLDVWSRAADAALRLGRYRDASKRLRRAAALPELKPVVKLSLMLRSLEANDRAKLRDDARADLERLETLILDARRKPLGAADAALVDEIAAAVKKHRERLPE